MAIPTGRRQEKSKGGDPKEETDDYFAVGNDGVVMDGKKSVGYLVGIRRWSQIPFHFQHLGRSWPQNYPTELYQNPIVDIIVGNQAASIRAEKVGKDSFIIFDKIGGASIHQLCVPTDKLLRDFTDVFALFETSQDIIVYFMEMKDFMMQNLFKMLDENLAWYNDISNAELNRLDIAKFIDSNVVLGFDTSSGVDHLHLHLYLAPFHPKFSWEVQNGKALGPSNFLFFSHLIIFLVRIETRSDFQEIRRSIIGKDFKTVSKVIGDVLGDVTVDYFYKHEKPLIVEKNNKLSIFEAEDFEGYCLDGDEAYDVDGEPMGSCEDFTSKDHSTMASWGKEQKSFYENPLFQQDRNLDENMTRIDPLFRDLYKEELTAKQEEELFIEEVGHLSEIRKISKTGKADGATGKADDEWVTPIEELFQEPTRKKAEKRSEKAKRD